MESRPPFGFLNNSTAAIQPADLDTNGKLWSYTPASNTERRQERKTPMTPSQAKRRPKRSPMRPKRDHYDVASYRRAIARACDLAGVPHWHLHQLRHNAATLLRKEFGIEAARVVLGHRSAAVTEVYAEIDHLKAADIMLRVG